MIIMKNFISAEEIKLLKFWYLVFNNIICAFNNSININFFFFLKKKKHNLKLN